jgi:hypothetical protein
MRDGNGSEAKPHELHRTKRGFVVVQYRNDLGNTEYQVRNWRGTVLTTRYTVEAAIKRADVLEVQAREREGGKHGSKD